MNGPPLSVTVEISQGLNNVVTIELIQGPNILIENAQRVLFPCDVPALPSWPPPDSVRSYGERLFERLCSAPDPKVAKAIDHVLNSNGTVYFKFFKADEWEMHAWEALCKETKFFLLNPDCGFARVVPPRENLRPVLFPLEKKVRLMTVLSAAGISAGLQWDALYAAAKDNTADAKGLAMELLVLTGEENLFDRIRQETRTKQAGLEVKLDAIGDTQASMVLGWVKRFRPHLLHFFCHGQIKGGVGMLRLADTAQHLRGLKDREFAESEKGSFIIDLDMLRDIARLARADRWLWLIVLNACKLGAAGTNVSALAQNLVAFGVPAAIGMTEEIDPLDASEFCRGFYPTVFAEIGRVKSTLTEAGVGAEIEWPKLLYESRIGISRKRAPASGNRQWTLPVLYLQPDGFQVQREKAEDVLTADTLNELMAALQGAPANVIAALKQLKA